MEESDMYLVTELSNMTKVDGQECWDIYSEKWCTASVTNVKYLLEQRALRLPPKCVISLSCGYCPEMDVTKYIKADGTQWYP